MASSHQYDAQAKSVPAKVETPKEVLKLDMEYKDKIYKVRLNLEELGVGKGVKTLYDFNEKMLKSKIEAFLKSYPDDRSLLKQSAPFRAWPLTHFQHPECGLKTNLELLTAQPKAFLENQESPFLLRHLI